MLEVKQNLVVKDVKNKKMIALNPDIKIQTEGTILLDYKFLGNDSEESQ